MGVDAGFYQQFGRNLRQARRDAGLSQADLAVAIELTRTSISNIENGRQGISLHTFGRMLHVLNARPGTLLPAARVPSALQSSGLTSLAQEERDFVERGLRQLGGENNESSFGTDPKDSKNVAGKA